MDCDHIGLAEQNIQRRIPVFLMHDLEGIVREHPHAEGLRDPCHAAAYRAEADDPNGLSRQLEGVISQQGEGIGPGPFPVHDVGVVAVRPCREVQDERECMLGHCVCGVARDIADREAVIPCGLQVDDVVSGCDHGNQLQFLERAHGINAYRDLVGDDAVRIRRALNRLVLGRVLVRFIYTEGF